MPIVTSTDPTVPSVRIIAALLLAAIHRLKELRLPHPSVGAVLAALQVSRSRAYELKARLEERLVELCNPAGRPSKQVPAPPPVGPATELLQYLYEHPGAIRLKSVRRIYSVGLRHFVLDLLRGHQEMSLDEFSTTTALPLGTLKDWLRGGMVSVEEKDTDKPEEPDIRGSWMKTVLAEWSAWQGRFTAFCDHVQLHCRIPWGRSMIQRVLEGFGVRIPRRRKGRSPDEEAVRESFRTWFPHAQWEGDGTQLPVSVDGELHVFNLELNVDAYSGAFVGAAVTRTEDSEAVLQTFRDSIAATAEQPLSLLLDNKPSNHTEAVEEALGDTILIRSTPYRGQSKPHVEGGFGLLKPTLQGLVLGTGGTRQQLAASFIEALVTAVLRVLNYKPRKDRQGLSRFQLLGDTPSPDEVERAHKALLELQAKQEKARATRAAGQDPVVRARLAAAYKDLHLDDPKGHFLTATARHPLDAVLEGIAIFRSKKARDTLPPDADARYLLGIVRNLTDEWESWEIALRLWDERVAARDQIATALAQQCDAIAKTIIAAQDLIPLYIDQAMKARSRLDRFFWLTTAADVITDKDPAHHRPLFRLAARRIAATFSAGSRERTAAIRFLAAKVIPLR